MSTTDKRFINIYLEKNPNPNSLKFVVEDGVFLEEGSVDFDNPVDAAKQSPLAEDLFRFSFVKRVFIAANFITVTKEEGIEWEEIAPMIKALIKGHLEENKPIFRKPVELEDISEDDPEIVKKIKTLLAEYIRPAVEMDGGAIKFRSWEEETGTVNVELHGACSGCPSSMVTLKSGIENLFKKMIPEVNQVEAEGV